MSSSFSLRGKAAQTYLAALSFVSVSTTKVGLAAYADRGAPAAQQHVKSTAFEDPRVSL